MILGFLNVIAINRVISLEVLGLLQDLLEDFVFGEGRIFVLGQGDDDVHLEFGLAVGAGGPVDVAGFVVNDELDLLGQVNKALFLVGELVFVANGFEDVVEGFFLVSDTVLPSRTLSCMNSELKISRRRAVSMITRSGCSIAGSFSSTAGASPLTSEVFVVGCNSCSSLSPDPPILPARNA